MTERWSDEAHRYLDGEGPPPPEAGVRVRADRFRGALDAYRATLHAPGAELDRAVMAAVRTGGPADRRSAWQWLTTAQISMRPSLAFAAALALVVASVTLTSLFGPPVRRSAGVPAERPGRGGTVLVRFELAAPDAARVALAGSFNAWNDSTIAFSRNARTGLWTVTVPLPPGEHQYLFVVDGTRWIPDPTAHAQVEDEFGQTNSVLVVGPRGVVRS